MTDVQTVTTGAPLEESAVEHFKLGMRGEVLRPGDEGYDAARRIWNGMIDRRPAIIARCAGAADVMVAVTFARQNNLLVAVRSGGHSFSGMSVCDGGIMIDLAPMKGVRVDPQKKTVRAQAGCTWSDVDHEAAAFGLATTGGQVSHTGIGGLTLGGGFGWLGRKFGFVVDNLLSVDIVTADGRLLTASASENPDLFWGVRGGGGNFGVVTSFEYRLHEVGPIVAGGLALFPAARAKEILQAYGAIMAAAPDELTLAAVFLSAPPAPFVPEEAHGAPMIGLAACYAGPLEEGLAALEPVQALGPVVDLLGPIPYTMLQKMLDAGLPHGMQYYAKSLYMPDLSEDVIDTLITHNAGRTSPTSVTVIFPFGGVLSRTPSDATAMGNRDSAYIIEIISAWMDPEETNRHIGWTRAQYAALEPFATGRVYVNSINDVEKQDVKTAYEPETYERLTGLKTRFDPTNLFRLNANIKPAAEA